MPYIYSIYFYAGQGTDIYVVLLQKHDSTLNETRRLFHFNWLVLLLLWLIFLRLSMELS